MIRRPRRAFRAPGGDAGYGHKNMQVLREDVYPPGERPALAGRLPGMPGKASPGRTDHQDLPALREELHVSVVRRALAQNLR